MKEQVRAVLADAIKFHRGEYETAPPGSSSPPENLPDTLTHFAAVHAGHHTKFKELNLAVLGKFAEAASEADGLFLSPVDLLELALDLT